MDWEFRAAERGNVALTAQLDPSQDEWTVGIALGRSAQSSATKLLQSLADPFDVHRAATCGSGVVLRSRLNTT